MIDVVDTDVDGLALVDTWRFMMTKVDKDEVTRLETRADPLAPTGTAGYSEDTLLDPSKAAAFCDTDFAVTDSATPTQAAPDLDPLVRAETAAELSPIAFPESGCVVAFNDGTLKTIAVAFVEIVTVDGDEMTLSELREKAVGFFRPPAASDTGEYVWKTPSKVGR
jgi:hypothetical protein